MNSFVTILLSLLGGITPALLWLWFWLREDKVKPEPRRRIIYAFLFGMVAVLLVLPLEKIIYSQLGNSIGVMTIFLWASGEELIKVLAAYFSALRYKDADEPVDFVIYMVTTALGFSAMENSFFLMNLIDNGLFTQTIISGNMRFLGATLLHLITSATIGVFMALSFYKNGRNKRLALLTGIMFAIGLHTLFNYFIIELGTRIFFVFAAVWVCIIGLILLFERVKNVKPIG